MNEQEKWLRGSRDNSRLLGPEEVIMGKGPVVQAPRTRQHSTAGRPRKVGNIG